MQELGEAARIFVYLELFRMGFGLLMMGTVVGIILWGIYAK